jgi:hypothetical protein
MKMRSSPLLILILALAQVPRLFIPAIGDSNRPNWPQAAPGVGHNPGGFTDITEASRIAFRHAASKTAVKFLPETMGGGVALFDINNDGRLDVFFTNGAKLDEKMTSSQQPDKRDQKYWDRLYQQNADHTFTDVTEKAGVKGARYNFGAAVGDVDNDGFEDLYVTGYGGNALYRNNGGGRFTDVTAKAGVAASGWSSSAGFFDYNNDGRLDLFVCRYLTWTWETNLYCGERKPGYRAYCHPDNYKGATNLLFLNNGDGTFTDVSKQAGVANPEGKSLGVAFNDFDRDGWTDVFVANDSVRQFLYRNKGDGTFEDVALLAGAGYNEDGKTFAGMGADFNDYDNDGWPDIVDTALGNERYALFRNNGDGSFTDSTNPTGVGEASLLMSGWGIRFFDYDNDGMKDLFVAQSHVLDTIEQTAPSLRYLLPPMMLRNTGQRFVDISAKLGSSFATAYAGRGASIGDLDNDGDIDIVMATLDQRPVVMRNETDDKTRWLTLNLIGAKSNRDAIGARIKLTGQSGRTQYQFVSTASSYQSASDRRAHFGLGADEAVKTIEIRWPSGVVQHLSEIKTNQILKIFERKGQ